MNTTTSLHPIRQFHRRIASFALVCVSAFPIFAIDWELRIGTADTDGDTPTPSNISLTRYLDDVAYGAVEPYAETPFVQRIGSISLDYATSDDEMTNVVEAFSLRIANTYKIDSESIGLALDYRDANSPHIFKFSMSQTEHEQFNTNLVTPLVEGPPFFEPNTTNSWSNSKFRNFTAGYAKYVSDQWTAGVDVTLGFGDSVAFDGFMIAFETKNENAGASVYTERLWNLSASTWFKAQGGISFARNEIDVTGIPTIENWAAAFEGEFFFSPRTSIGAIYSKYEGRGNQAYGASFAHYFTNTFKTKIGYTRVDSNRILPNTTSLVTSSDVEAWAIELSLRF